MVFASMSVKHKISGMMLLVALLTISVAGFFIYHLKLIGEKLDIFTDISIPSLMLIKDTENTLATLRQDQFYLLSNVEHPDFDDTVHNLSRLMTQIDDNIAEYKKGLWDERDRVAHAAVSTDWLKYREAAQQYSTSLASKDMVKANAVLVEAFPAYQALKKSMQDILELNFVYNDEDSKAAKQQLSNAMKFGVIAIVSVLIATSVLAFIIVKQICTPLDLVKRMATSIAAGDLTYHLQRDKIGNDELGELADSCQDMQQNLKSLAGNLSNTAMQISTAIEEVSAISAQTSNGMNEQQEQITQIATAMNQMQATVNEVANNTEDASNAASEVSQEAGSGMKVVEQSIDEIRGIQSAIADMGALANELDGNANHINVVVDVIQEITEQTNLLALNAAIEAARAGEHGRGFAVVADEVRTLAKRTQSSTEEINGIIGELQQKAKKAVDVTTKSNNQMSLCMEQAENAGTNIRTIEHGVGNIANMNTQIASACSEQSSVTEELSRNIESINQSSTEVAEGAQQTAKACHSLSELAMGMQDIVAKFRLS